MAEKVKGLEKLLRKLENLKGYQARIRAVFDLNTYLMATYIKQRMLSGPTTSKSLSVRTGKARRTTRQKKAIVSSKRVSGGILFGAGYMRTHVGRRGKKVTIRPKTKQYLTIPLPAAKTAAGRLRGSARSGVFQDTFIAKSKKGNLIVFGKFGKSKKAKLAPLFVLKKKVVITQRTDTKEIMRIARRRILKDLKQEVYNSVK